MRRISTRGKECPTTRTPPAWIGLVLLALWIGWTVPALAALLRPAPAEDTADIIADRLSAHALLPAATGAATLLQLAPPCSCTDAVPAAASDDLDGPAWRGPRLDLRARGPAPDLPYELILLDAEGAVRYAGPSAIATGCGLRGDRSVPFAGLLAGPSTAPLVLPVRCRC